MSSVNLQMLSVHQIFIVIDESKNYLYFTTFHVDMFTVCILILSV